MVDANLAASVGRAISNQPNLYTMGYGKLGDRFREPPAAER